MNNEQSKVVEANLDDDGDDNDNEEVSLTVL